MDGYERAIATIQRGYYNPTCKWVKDCQGLRNPDHAVKAVKVILQMQKLFPPSEKFA
jgi:hypothetical protein